MKKLFAIALVLVLAFAAIAEEISDGQNPVMNLIGDYMDKVGQRASMHIECAEENGAKVEISWGNSAFETYVWRFTGIYDTESNTIAYKDCVLSIENGEDDPVIVYENGTGLLIVTENWEILWTDDVENAGKDCVFEFFPVITEETIAA